MRSRLFCTEKFAFSAFCPVLRCQGLLFVRWGVFKQMFHLRRENEAEYSVTF